MGMFDKAKDFVEKNADKIDKGIDKAGDLVDKKTDRKYADKVDKAQEFLKDKTGPSDKPPAAR